MKKLGRHYNAFTISLSGDAVCRINELYEHQHHQVVWFGDPDGEIPRRTDNDTVKERIISALDYIKEQVRSKERLHDLDQSIRKNQDDKQILDVAVPVY